jgi:hypothetical protein
MVSRVGRAGVLALLIVCGCSKAAPKPKPQVASPALGWTIERKQDTMTDRVTIWLHSPPQPSGGALNIACDDRGEFAYIDGNDVLQMGGFTGSDEYTAVQYRVDHNKMVEAGAGVSGKIAVLKNLREFPDAKRTPPLEVMSQMDGKTFIAAIQAPGAKMLRVRLRGLGGRIDDLGFDLTGFTDKLNEVEKRCGMNGDGSASQNASSSLGASK